MIAYRACLKAGEYVGHWPSLRHIQSLSTLNESLLNRLLGKGGLQSIDAISILI